MVKLIKQNLNSNYTDFLFIVQKSVFYVTYFFNFSALTFMFTTGKTLFFWNFDITELHARVLKNKTSWTSFLLKTRKKFFFYSSATTPALRLAIKNKHLRRRLYQLYFFFNYNSFSYYNFFLIQVNNKILYTSNYDLLPVRAYALFIEKKKSRKFFLRFWYVNIFLHNYLIFSLTLKLNFLIFLENIFFKIIFKQRFQFYNFNIVRTFYDMRSSAICDLLSFNSSFI